MRRIPPQPSPASTWKPKPKTTTPQPQTDKQNQNNQPPKITRPQPQIPSKIIQSKQENELKEIKQTNEKPNTQKEEKIQTTPIRAWKVHHFFCTTFFSAPPCYI